MAKPEGEEDVEPRTRACRGLGAALAALAAVAALTVGVACLHTRHRHQLTDLQLQVDNLKQLVEDMRRQLARHDTSLNASLSIQPKTVDKTGATEEVYETEEYEYDTEDSSYEYDDNDEPEKKLTVKRTPILSESLVRNDDSTKTEDSKEKLRGRRRREVRGEAVPVRDESGFDLVENYKRPPQNYEQLNQPSHHIHSSGYQELRRPTESTVRLRHHRNGIRGVEALSQYKDENVLHSQTSTEKEFDVLAAHFVGDTSAYSNKDHHPVYKGNHILHHSFFKDWIPAKWMYEFNLHYEFPLEDGKVVIQTPGLYLIYAQIYYAGSHDRCGFHLKHNETEVAQCMTTTIGRHMEKRNTCFTAIVLYLNQFDRIWIKEVEGNRNTSFKSFHSFFGLVQLKTIR